MRQQFFIQGIHGKHCMDKITNFLIKDLQAKDISFNQDASLVMFDSNLAIDANQLNNLLSSIGNYKVNLVSDSEFKPGQTLQSNFAAYKPIYLIFSYLIVANVLIALPDLNIDQLMINFMASFFLIFSFFKLLDLAGFANGYAAYDIVAKKYHYYGYLYPFIELGFGLAYIVNGKSLSLNIVVLVIMGISSIGVIKAKLSRQKFHCACVGTFLKVPLSNIAIIEDILMVLMSLGMILKISNIT